MKIYLINPTELNKFLAKEKKNFFSVLNLTNKQHFSDMITSNTKNLELPLLDKEKILNDYNELIGKINNKNNSILWWAELISSKNLYVSSLYINICKFLKFIFIIKNTEQDKKILVLIEERDLFNQIASYCKKNKINFVYYGYKKDRLLIPFKILNQIIKHNIYFLISGWKKKKLINKSLKKIINKNFSKKKSYYIIRTWVDKRSFDKNDTFSDAYFGKLSKYLQDKRDVIILAGILSDFEQNIIKIKKNIQKNLIVPQEYFIGYFDYIEMVFYQLFRDYNQFDEVKFHDYNISLLINGEIKKSLYFGEVRNNLFYFYLTKKLSNRLKCNTFVYTFENHAWEKMMILGMRKYSPDTYLVGYQHASVLLRELNYFPSKKETQDMPFPDKIISAGIETKKILEKYGNYPNNLIKSGCALRYENTAKKDLKPKSKNKKILVAFSIGLQESSKLLSFLLKSFEKEKSILILLKSHPLLPLNKILFYDDLKIPNNFRVVSNKNIEDLSNEIDMLIYSETTLCIEALMRGIPVIYADINKFFNSDPLFDCSYLKWTVKTKEEIMKVVNEIYEMNYDEFTNQQRLARSYIENYFLSVTDKRLEEFIIR